MLRYKQYALRALVDVAVIAAVVAVCLVVMWAWHGQEAYVVIKNTMAQQQAAQQRMQAPRPVDPPKKD